jgi:PST family polysaccharide transporter
MSPHREVSARRRDGLAHRAAWGVVWAVTGTVAVKALGLITVVVLARLLVPAEYGLFAFCLVYLAYLETIGDLGTGMALIYWPARTRDAAQVTFVINVATGAGLAFFTLVTAPAAAGFFGMPEAAPLLRVLAWSFLVRGLGNTHDALCRKDLRFRARLWPEVGLAAVKAAVAVPLAAAGLGVWSLVWGQLAGATVATVLLWAIVRWRPTLHWPADLVRPMLRYGAGIVAVNMLAAVVHHLDAVVVARTLGPAALGIYQIAYRVPEMIVSLLVWQAGKVMFPSFAQLRKSGGDVGAAYVVSLKYLALLAGPFGIGLFLLADPLVLTLFGSAWAPAAAVLRALALFAALRALGSPTGEVLKAAGRPELLAALAGVKAALMVPCLLLASRGGLVAVAWTVTGVGAATTLLSLAASSRIAGVSPASILTALRPCAAVTAVVAVAVASGAWLTRGAPPALTLALGSAAGLAAFAAVVGRLDPALIRHVAATLRRPRRTQLAKATP